MKKLLLLTSIASCVLFAQSQIQTCQKCHPEIVKEFEESMHRKSTYHHDEIHKSVWEKHPLKQKDDYTCAECHAPGAKSEQELQKGITCASCHTIKDVEKHASANKNVYETKPKTFYSAQAGREGEKVVFKEKSSWFGLNKETVGSPYHDIDYTNEIYYNGEVCMGCHSHRQNSAGLKVCDTGEEGAKDKGKNCITCHMPQVEGSATTIRHTKTHAFHGFAGTMNNPQMLAEHIELDLKKSAGGFEVIVHNKAPHDLLLHPLRVVELRVSVVKDSKSSPLKTYTFARVIGNEEGASMPWLANKVLSDTMIKANEKRSVAYTDNVDKKSQIEVQLGYYTVNPKAVDKLGLKGNEKAEKFTVLKQKYFSAE